MERRKGIIDMISGLPDEILLHILSFLPTNVSVRTSVLAKRWRFLWAHVPKLEFYNEYFWERRKKMQKKKKTICLEIIEKVISMHEAKTVNTFSISNVVGYEDRAEALISYAIERNIQNMYLEFNGLTEWAFPRLLLTCKTLVDLKLENFGMIPSKGELFLPSLKKLYLRNIDHEDKESLPHLLSGCPVLEELFVNDDFRGAGNNLNCFIVSSATIKTLDLHLPRWHEEYDDEMLIIDVPTLVYLNVYNCNLKYAKSLTKTMTSLIEAKIHINDFLHDCGIDCTKCGCSIAFLSSLCHVRCLKIPYMSVDISETSSMPKFVNLIKLNLDSIIDWKYVVKWLEVADNLEVLLFCSDWVPYTEPEPERVPTSMLSRLRIVTVTSFDYCNEGAFDMVRYILKNAKILERMEIRFDEEKLDACRRISLFERGSKSCELAFTFNRY